MGDVFCFLDAGVDIVGELAKSRYPCWATRWSVEVEKKHGMEGLYVFEVRSMTPEVLIWPKNRVLGLL